MVTRVGGFILLVLVGSCTTYTSDLLTGSAQGGETTAGAAGQALSGAGSQADGGKAEGSSGSATGGVGSVGGVESDGGGMGGTSAVVVGAGGDGGEAPGPLPAGEGSITYKRWVGVPGSSMSDFPTDAPDEVSQVGELKAPTSTAEYTADRIQGYITAPLDGNYRFWLACDDNGELWLSTDESAEKEVRIAYLLGVDRWAETDEWGKFASQESALIPLQAGKRYRVDALVKQGVGGSNLSVGWLKPGDAGVLPSEVIPGRQLSPIPAL